MVQKYSTVRYFERDHICVIYITAYCSILLLVTSINLLLHLISKFNIFKGVYIGRNSTYRVEYYPQFQAFTRVFKCVCWGWGETTVYRHTLSFFSSRFWFPSWLSLFMCYFPPFWFYNLKKDIIDPNSGSIGYMILSHKNIDLHFLTILIFLLFQLLFNI
jgi:hypothetical protein